MDTIREDIIIRLYAAKRAKCRRTMMARIRDLAHLDALYGHGTYQENLADYILQYADDNRTS